MAIVPYLALMATATHHKETSTMTTTITTISDLLNSCDTPNTIETGLCVTNIVDLADQHEDTHGYRQIIEAAHDRFSAYCIKTENIAHGTVYEFQIPTPANHYDHFVTVDVLDSGFYYIKPKPSPIRDHVSAIAFTKGINAIAEWMNDQAKAS